MPGACERQENRYHICVIRGIILEEVEKGPGFRKGLACKNKIKHLQDCGMPSESKCRV